MLNFLLFLLLASYHGHCSETTSSRNEQQIQSLCHGVNTVNNAPDYPAVVCALLERGADPNGKDKTGITPLHHAVVANELKNAEVLVAYGAEVNAQGRNGYSPLHYVAQGDNSDMAALLLKHNADVNLPAKNGMTPLHVSAYYGSKKVAAVLLAHGADLSARDGYGRTPLDVARGRAKQFVDEWLLPFIDVQKSENSDESSKEEKDERGFPRMYSS